jgi:hypothetical protein
VNVYSLVALPDDGTVTEVIGYQIPVTPEPILSGSVKLMFGVKLAAVAELLYQVTLILSPEKKLRAVPATP